MKKRNGPERGSALIMAVFVLALLSMAGAALLFLSTNELRSNDASLNSKEVYYASEGGLEDGRATIYDINKISLDPQDLSEELEDVAGPDDVIDFDPANLQVDFDTNGNFTGFSGYNDDVPLRPVTAFGDGWYVAFMRNDPVEGETTVVDIDDRVLVTGIAVREDRSMEMVHAIVHRPDTFAELPATITVLGPNPVFDGGSSNAKIYTGNESGGHCPTGGGEKPVVGVIGGAAETAAEAGVIKPLNYTEGTTTGLATVDDLTLDPNLPPMFTDCGLLLELAQLIYDEADLIGNSVTPQSDLGTPGTPKSVFIVGDYDISGNFDGAGMLFVTGQLTIDGQSGWEGPIFVVGEGDFLRDGAGNGTLSGGILVSDISGPDRVLFTGDDCSGEDGILGNGDDGVAESSFVVNGAGSSTTGYCSAFFNQWQSLRPFAITSFLQD